MPAGGNWTAQNKIRPGAFINFVSVPSALSVLGTRGVVAVGMPMTWGAPGELIKLTGEDLLTGASLAKVGVTIADTEASLPYRVALAGCYTALLFRTDVGGNKAVATILADTLTVSAKYPGSTGNAVSVVILKDKPETGSSTIQVLVNSLVKETFVVTAITDLTQLDSSFVEFQVAEGKEKATVPATAGVALLGGTNGEVKAETYTTFFNLLDTQNFQAVAIYGNDATVPALLKSRVDIWRNKRGKKVQAVAYNSPASDVEGIISVNQGFKTSTETVDANLFPVYVASITAGAAVNESLTAKVVQDAVEIIDPVLEDEIEDALKVGRFILTYRQDGAVCVEKDINTLHTFTVDKNYAFSKNRVIRCLDEIGNTASLIFNRNYCGKVDNNSIGRNQYKTELISYLDTLVNIGAITNFDGARDVTVLPGESIDAVVVDLAIQPVDSMEKLYMTVNVNA